PHLTPSDRAMSFITPRSVRGSSFSIGGRLFASRPSARRSSTIALAITAFISTGGEDGSGPTGVAALPVGPALAVPPGAGPPSTALLPGAASVPAGAGPSCGGAAPPAPPPQAAT